MESSATESLRLPSFMPPTNNILVIKDKLNLVVELLAFLFVILPYYLLLTVYRKLYPPPEKSLQTKNVIVTGAGHGLGRGLALRLAREGAKVAVVDVDGISAAQTARDIVETGGVARSYVTNVAKIEEIRKLHVNVVRDLGPVDLLINNAGLLYTASIKDSSEAEIRTVMDVNLLSHFWIAQEYLTEMKSRNSGHIVAISSMAAIASVANGSAYSASKWGVCGFMEVLRAELNQNQKNNVKTTTILPYFINTSEQYVNRWDIRLPPLSIDEVVEEIVTAVKREEVLLSIPRHMYYTSLIKLLPVDIGDYFFSILYCKLKPPSEEEKLTDRTHNLISEQITN
ncbi:17-beta-hydroxysteroid dehydrogenase 13-like [Macrosteles quadrilineatus]|uniref:17-beta-hydroxysteroid dehydrogenase 13-like n=1 Tax=Macrosteles quadrilineatus TaxID=74068 RepID=UPI0023E2B183|nr:17-beta-hydroxysteroid dehydrogenase 13-like [Macrosteles quadrilineatus]